MDKESKLTISELRYIGIIGKECSKNRANVAFIKDISDSLNVKSASACSAITRLEKKGLVINRKRRCVELTQKGMHVFEHFDKKMHAAWCFLDCFSKTNDVDLVQFAACFTSKTIECMRDSIYTKLTSSEIISIGIRNRQNEGDDNV